MKRLCVIGNPVGHSKSPLIQNTMLRALGLDYVYSSRRVAVAELPQWLEQVRREGWSGFNATMPHKQALIPLMDHLDRDAELFGAVNTVCYRNGEFFGCNTDGGGFARALEGAGMEIRGARFVLLGAGGAAKAVALKLAQRGAAQVRVCNRTAEKAAALAACAPEVLTVSGFSPAELAEACAGAGALINCTNLGMAGFPAFESLDFLEALPPGAPVWDVIYHPLKTELLRRAEILGHPAQNGLPMLIHQAILALEHFTGASIDPQTMMPLVQAALAGEEGGAGI